MSDERKSKYKNHENPHVNLTYIRRVINYSDYQLRLLDLENGGFNADIVGATNIGCAIPWVFDGDAAIRKPIIILGGGEVLYYIYQQQKPEVVRHSVTIDHEDHPQAIPTGRTYDVTIRNDGIDFASV